MNRMVNRSVHGKYQAPEVLYKAKIKLHGTNAGVQIKPNGQVIAQGRNCFITPGDDNMGFARWVATRENYFRQFMTLTSLTIFGEWCGYGIQKGCAISSIEKKIFAVFAIQQKMGRADTKLTINPDQITDMLKLKDDEDRIYVLPWYGNPVMLDYGDVEQLQIACDKINEMVLEVEKSDPWVRKTFGIDGMGEGLVFYPSLSGTRRSVEITDYMFKAKGEKHRVVKAKEPAQIDPEIAASISEFVDLVVTEPRLKQALQEACEETADIRKTGNFLKWISKDLQKECQVELEAADLTWKQVSKPTMQKAKIWFNTQITL